MNKITLKKFDNVNNSHLGVETETLKFCFHSNFKNAEIYCNCLKRNHLNTFSFRKHNKYVKCNWKSWSLKRR